MRSVLKDSVILDINIQSIASSLKMDDGDVMVSYSQYSTYAKCPKSWELKSIRRIKEDSPSINLVFGNAMHTVIQKYLTVLYTKTVKVADEIDLNGMLKEQLSIEYKNAKQKAGYHFSTPVQMSEYYEDGLEIINYLKKKRLNYFSTKEYQLVGIEVPLLITPNENHPKVKFSAYLDLVFRTKNSPYKYFIIDLKTSTKGWGKWDKEDRIKTSQVLLYKKYFAEQYGVNEDNIEVSFLILKRKLQIDSMYPQRRLQKFLPTQGKLTMKNALKPFVSWIDAGFQSDGTYNETNYPALAGKNNWNCRFCPYNERLDLCPKENRIVGV